MALGADSIRIGSGSDCELVLHDTTVSSRHAEIQIGARGYTIRDLGSKNGVVIETVQVERAPLVDGLRIRLGTTTLQVRSLGGRHSLPLSKAGDYVVLRAEMDCIVALSACPQDLVPINGKDCIPTEAHYQVL